MENKIDEKNWTIADDMYILQEIIYRCRYVKDIERSNILEFMESKSEFITRVAQEIGVKENSLEMRIKNQLAFLTEEKEGLKNYALNSQLAVKKYLRKYSKMQLYMFIKSII
jgi:hypothetical protein